MDEFAIQKGHRYATVRVIAMDEFAIQKGHRYASVVVEPSR